MNSPDMSKYVAATSPIRTVLFAPMHGRNPFLRCSVPQSVATSPDSLRQFYQSGIPQYRIIPPLSRGSNSNS